MEFAIEHIVPIIIGRYQDLLWLISYDNILLTVDQETMANILNNFLKYYACIVFF